jgi:hypothetical protein
MGSSASLAIGFALGFLFVAGGAWADGTCTATPTGAPVTWGGRSETRSAPAEESPVVRARELLSRAKFLDESAAAEDKASANLEQRLPALRASAKATRERAGRATGADHDILLAFAEDLDADVLVSEAETVSKRREAVENRRVARELRARAVKLVREAPTTSSTAPAKCDPPYRFTPDGRKTYLFECLRSEPDELRQE